MSSFNELVFAFNKAIDKKYYKQLEQQRKDFVHAFNVKKIASMTIDEYIIGNQNKDSFCHKIEYELKELGDCRGSYAIKYGIYRDNSGKIQCAKKYGNNTLVFDNVKKEILDLLTSAQNNDIVKIDINKLSPMFKAKLLYLYFPGEFLPIYNRTHLELFLTALNVSFNKKATATELNLSLLNWKNSSAPQIIKQWTNLQFMRFLYEHYSNIALDIEDFIDLNYKNQTNGGTNSSFNLSNVNYKKVATMQVNGVAYYPRNHQLARAILSQNNYLCEIDSLHKSFIRALDGKTYTEPHHLIPLSRYKDFDCSLDIPENIVSLCSDCHNCIHYGRDSAKLLTALFQKKGVALNNALLKATKGKQGITLSQLLSFYK